MILEKYPLLGGRHPDTAVLKNILAYQGLKAPHTGQPFSEAMLLGIGGGLGMGYILWEFKEAESRTAVFGFRNNWQYPVRFMKNLCSRLKVRIYGEETSGSKRAYQYLQHALQVQQPAMIWVDLQGLPYWMIPAHFSGHAGHVVGVYGLDEAGGTAWLDDRATSGFPISREELAQARSRIVSYKNRLITFEISPAFNLEEALQAGVMDAALHLSQPSTSFSIPAVRKWARLMTDTRNAKGWKQVFADRRGLYSTLKSVFLNVQPNWSSGGTLRSLYADFLREAAPLLSEPRLLEAADLYQRAEGLWLDLGEKAFPDDSPVFKSVKQLEKQKLTAMLEKGPQGLEEVRRIKAEISTAQRGIKQEFPLTDSQISRIFNEMGEQLWTIYHAETDANRLLCETVLSQDEFKNMS